MCIGCCFACWCAANIQLVQGWRTKAEEMKETSDLSKLPILAKIGDWGNHLPSDLCLVVLFAVHAFLSLFRYECSRVGFLVCFALPRSAVQRFGASR